MTAQGKMTAAGLAAAYAKGQALRILVEHEDADFAARMGREPNIIPATRKTGVVTVLITGTEVGMYRTGVGGRAQRVYRFATSIGHIQAVPAQTFILAPEDPAGIKRAHVEALDMDQERAVVEPVTEQTDGGVTEVTEQVKPFRPVVTAEPGHLTLVKDPAPSLKGLSVERPRVVKGDVVTIHKGTRYYDVLRTSEEYARVCPVDPMDHRDPEWVSFDLLHVVPPVCEVTVKFGTYPWSAEAFRLEGNGWDADRPVMARIKMLQVDPQRLARPTIVRAAGVPTTEAVGVLRIGSAITIQGRTFQVVWDGGPGEPRLEPSSIRGRIPAQR